MEKLTAALRDYIEKHPDGELITNTKAEMVGQNDTSVWVSAKKVDGSVKKFKGRFLIGTDGARSIVRKSIGAKI